MKLIIVESPTKARTISRFLGSEVVVEASMGHIRDLPRSAAEVPESFKGEEWARLGVNVEAGFEPIYVVPKERRDRVKMLKDLLKTADELYLATDEDREGESIAWHLTEVLKPKVAIKRMVFHEITEAAIRRAFEQPREIDQRLVDAQEARRILDRLYGYELSPVLWRRVRQGLSAGRVQSVAVRIVVERERERINFRSAGYWDVEGVFRGGEPEAPFPASLVAVDGLAVADGSDFDETGKVTSSNVVVLDEKRATGLTGELAEADFTVRTVETKPYRRSPYPPFRTSTLQQEASRKLRFSASRTMSVAQRLYEAGYITYMRTDSTALSEAAIAAARAQVTSLFGDRFLPDKPRSYSNKVKNAQEAHEAIRPSGDQFRTPERVAREVGQDEAKLYELVWKRTLASQMADAVGVSLSVRLGAVAASGADAEFGASGRTITFPGFLRVYVEGSDDPEAALDDQETGLPALTTGSAVIAEHLDPAGHATKPPARFTEASLVRRMEELGVGRPSTYASILSTIEDRGYVWKKGQALVPSFTAFAVVTLLEVHFPDLVDYAFTARMEDDLDQIARGEQETVPWLSRFYLPPTGLSSQVANQLDEIDARQVNSIPLGSDPQGREIVLRVGRYGPFLERGEDKAPVPDNLAPDELTIEKAIELIEEKPAGDKILGTDPDSGLVVLARNGRYGPYVQLGETGAKEKPKTSSLLKGMTVDELSLDMALRLLTLPRTVGVDPEKETEILAQNGRYGPYLSRGEERRSLEAEEHLFSITLDEALELFQQPPRRRGQASSTSVPAPAREIGLDPVSGKAVTVRSGRFGPYVTDGDVNASLRTADDSDTITLERAAELLQARRDRLASGETSAKKPRRKRT
ncbi:MAG TPA: type I DNA topoisomerase [Acidimicrobiia bacterium]|nr:type I DNA topoisomerase [Acidimicrobiia bacterium]